ncbi:hypothetical protein EVAR_41879_1 [Eumeta japonica]|uniref:Uncharacterized protein n=1 Tax=Eumeta variegata TaxID=151549 RepID=A0A4C1XCZ9_EUMVA|nr:hypothetical protein EVAR_41879_1 [Eumeta japonica]
MREQATESWPWEKHCVLKYMPATFKTCLTSAGPGVRARDQRPRASPRRDLQAEAATEALVGVAFFSINGLRKNRMTQAAGHDVRADNLSDSAAPA